MKKNIFIVVLLCSVLFSLHSAPLFGQKVKTDVNARTDVKKEEVKKDSKKVDVKKEVTIKKMESLKGNRDKVIGKTKDGKIIYEGPRGGRYYLSAKGTKVYVKKGEKL